MGIFPRQDIEQPSPETRGSDMVDPGKDVLSEEEQPTNQRAVGGWSISIRRSAVHTYTRTGTGIDIDKASQTPPLCFSRRVA